MTKISSENTMYKGYDLYIERRLGNYLTEFCNKTYKSLAKYEQKKRTTKNLLIFCVILVIASLYPEFGKGFKAFITGILENTDSNSVYIQDQFDTIEQNNSLWHFFMPLVLASAIGFYIVKRPHFSTDLNIIRGAFGFWGEFYSNEKKNNIIPDLNQLLLIPPNYDDCKSLWQVSGNISKHNIQIQQLELKQGDDIYFKPLLISLDTKNVKLDATLICSKNSGTKLKNILLDSNIVSLISNQPKIKTEKYIKDLVAGLENTHAYLATMFKDYDIHTLQIRIHQGKIHMFIPYYSLFFVPDYTKNIDQDIVLIQNIMRIIETTLTL